MPRTVGAVGKRTTLAARILRERFPDYDALVSLATIATTTDDPDLEYKCSKEVAKYIYPALKATEHSGEGGGPLKANVRIVFENAPERPE